VNEWSTAEAAQHVAAASAAADAADAEGGWRLDVRWLARAGVPGGLAWGDLPPDVAAVCVPWD
jgi:hypothetical protein